MNDITIIIKRLILIKNLIALEDEEDLIVQINKLQNIQINEDIQDIINHLHKKLYSQAIVEIDKFINFHNQIAFYIDPEIQALHYEAKSLEKQIQELSNEKAELDKLIHDFSVRHNRELGELILKILQYRKEKSNGTLQQEEAEKDYEDFHTDYQATKSEKVAILNKEEDQEIKEKYRKASKLCHPDVVDEDQKKLAHKIFMELNSAYKKNDLQRVTEILEELLQGKAFTSKADTSNKKSILIAELERLRNRTMEISAEITAIKTSATFIKIKGINNWDEYFKKTKERLQKQLNELKNERKSVNKI